MLQTPAWAEAQRSLRTSILDGDTRLSRPARDLAAHLLLNLDDVNRCWREAATWLCDFLTADRIDGGFHASLELPYQPQIEVRRHADAMPSILDATFHPRASGDVTTWTRPGPTFFGDIARDARLDDGTRSCLAWHRAGSKLALPLFADDVPVGIVCADWMGTRSAAPDLPQQTLLELSTQVLGPILVAARSLANAAPQPDRAAPPVGLDSLTPAERRVARLVARGLSYKAVARQLGCSLATVDHHLRSIRAKFNVASTAQLTALLVPLFIDADPFQ